jgi:hypothetical protein
MGIAGLEPRQAVFGGEKSHYLSTNRPTHAWTRMSSISEVIREGHMASAGWLTTKLKALDNYVDE